MAARRKKSRWTLKHVNVEVNLLVAKVGALFSKEPVKTRRRTARKARKIVEAEYRVITTSTPTLAVPRVRRSSTTPLYPVFGVDENGLPKNVIGDTIISITSTTRARAVRDGDAVMALAAALVEQVVVDSARKNQNDAPSGAYWT